MQNREFEKQVRHKMQDLRFAPGADVWAAVQAGIQKKKRRRPVVFWFLFAGLLVGGAALVYNFNNETNKNNAITKDAAGIENATDAVIINQQKATPKPSKREHIVVEKKVVIEKPIVIKESVVINKPIVLKEPVAIDKPVIFNEAVVNDKLNVLDESIVTNNRAIIDGSIKEIVESFNPTPATPQFTQSLNAPIIHIKNPVITQQQQETPSTPIKKNRSSRFQWGINASAGISDVGAQLFKASNVADLTYANISTPVIPVANRKPSAINAGKAFQIGAFIAKPISKKLAVKAGLNYEYFSNSIMVGTQFNASRVVNQGSTMRVVDAYFTNGNDAEYINKYHFISMPVSLQWKLINGNKHSLFWENGIQVSRLLSANSLYYDGISDTYYKDNDLLHKTQVSASTALLFTIKQSNKFQIYAGPQLQYGISNLVAENASGQNHLRYAGIKIAAGFSKK